MSTRIPVKFINGHWELLYGGGIPVADGTYAELLVEPQAITDQRLRESVTHKRRIKILDADTPLCIALKPAVDLDESLLKFLLGPSTIRHEHTAKIGADSQFVQIHLHKPTEIQERRGERSGGIWLLLEGVNPRGVESSTVALPDIPSLRRKTATSLNHAYTLLSELFETWRESHTGNIYEHVLYQDSDERWYPLKDLRDYELARAERQVIKKLWVSVAEQMPPPFNGEIN